MHQWRNGIPIMKAQALMVVGMFLLQAFAEESSPLLGDSRSSDTSVPSWFLGALTGCRIGIGGMDPTLR